MSATKITSKKQAVAYYPFLPHSGVLSRALKGRLQNVSGVHQCAPQKQILTIQNLLPGEGAIFLPPVI